MIDQGMMFAGHLIEVVVKPDDNDKDLAYYEMFNFLTGVDALLDERFHFRDCNGKALCSWGDVWLALEEGRWRGVPDDQAV